MGRKNSGIDPAELSRLTGQLCELINSYEYSRIVQSPDHAPLKFQEPKAEAWVEAHRRWRPEGFYRIHCAHDKPLWEPCGSQTCRRGQKEARQNLLRFISGGL